jgi:hypothetical protein
MDRIARLRALSALVATTSLVACGDATSAVVLRFGDNGEFMLAEADVPGGAGRPGFELGWLEFDPATQKTSRLLALDTNGDWGTSHLNANDGLASITDSAITTKAGETFGRLTDSGSGIVGLWALGSPTDLKVTQFVFFPNGRVLSIHPAETSGSCATSRQGPPGSEWSDYTFTAGTGALRIFNKIHDTGAFDSADAVPNSEATIVLTMAADQKTFTFAGDGGETLTAYRIAVNP